jgi:hypothetical protein
VKTDRSGKLRRCSELPPEPASYSRCLQSSLQSEVHNPTFGQVDNFRMADDSW